ncbi:hypothetical protein SPRG_11645 [Saprolegnia parasitica CBS 223.65]|uniref:Transmembrane protein n=1 Tax=Saprolegnia parasitica (strain CBS 223.65) TaxID=695850 RepID=A0A067C9W6_SAPPC|nr:hypothetical protein SPRG_11645 [Saprolegnia parasitica CBS 223.65]KDO23331.1 hypothetical protein SPRG_11645 [Saprolegnia parasitica CBS 223.65]|eukprot:XP_012205983.1 hypothetical protein SPRG_11645 [Saprolegnia parasitica CBS 223.65]
MGMRGDMELPKRARRHSSRMQIALGALVVSSLCACAVFCFLLSTSAQALDRTGASDLFEQGAIASRMCPRETVVYVFSSGCLYAVWVIVILLAQTTRRGLPLLVVVALLSVGCVIWGVLGAIWSSRKGCPETEPLLFTMAMATSAVFIFVGLPVSGLLVSYSLRTLVPSHHREQWLLSCLRCSCVSSLVKRGCVVLPFVALTATSVALLAAYGHAPCSKPFALYVGVSSALFGTLTLLLCTCYVVSRKQHASSSQRVVVGCLLLLSVTALGWAIFGSTLVSHPVLGCPADLFHAVQLLRIFLFVVSITLGALTLCCQVERFCQSSELVEDEPALTIAQATHVIV